MRSIIEAYLLDREEILWQSQPDPTILFTSKDWFLVPFSFLWGGFAIFWEYDAIKMAGNDIIMILFGIPFIIIGLYFMFGRFLYKIWLKKRTFMQ